MANEASDLELEMIDSYRKLIKLAVGNVAIEDGWKCSLYSVFGKITSITGNDLVLDTPTNLFALITNNTPIYRNNVDMNALAVNPNTSTNTITVATPMSFAVNDVIELKLTNTILIKAGQAWFEGLPFEMQSGQDQRVSGSNLALGNQVAVGGGSTNCKIQDEPYGQGKLLTFNGLGLTPTGTYRLLVKAQEKVITNNEDPFLKNANIPEATSQKVRLIYYICIVPEADQVSMPVPYTSTSQGNLTNEIVIIPQAGLNGSEVSRTTITGSEQIDGRNLEIIIRNDPAGTNPAYGSAVGNLLPNSASARDEYSNGVFIDSNGNKYHLNAIIQDTVAGREVLRIDKSYLQPDPVITNGVAYRIIKRDVYVTTDSDTQVPLGELNFPIAKVVWHQVSEITHPSKITDLRPKVITNQIYQDVTNIKFGLKLTQGGLISFGVAGSNLVRWTAPLSLINPSGPEQTIADNTVAMIEGSSITYKMSLSGGIIGTGNIPVNVVSPSGPLAQLQAPEDLTNVKVGNLLRDNSTGQICVIIGVDEKNNQLSLATPLANSGAMTIYTDAYAPGYSPVEHDRFVLAVRKGAQVFFGSALELKEGEENEIGDGISQQILAYIGATDELDSTPAYTSVNLITQGSPLNAAISTLDAELNNVYNILNTPMYYERILYPLGLAALTNITIPLNSRNGNAQETFDPTKGELMIFVNGVYKFQGEVWEAVDNQTIRFFDALNQDTEVVFRRGNFGGSGSGGGGLVSLQDAYGNGPLINVVTGVPMHVSATSGTALKVTGDLEVTGVIL